MKTQIKRTDAKLVSMYKIKDGKMVMNVAAKNKVVMKALLPYLEEQKAYPKTGAKLIECDYGVKLSFVCSDEESVRTALRKAKGKHYVAKYAGDVAKYVKRAKQDDLFLKALKNIDKQAEQATEIDLERKSLKELVEMYNEKAEKKIKRFADKKSAVRRVKALVA